MFLFYVSKLTMHKEIHWDEKIKNKLQACIDIWRYKSGLINNFPEKKVHIWKRGSVFKLRKQLKRTSFAAVLNIIRQSEAQEEMFQTTDASYVVCTMVLSP